MARNCSRRECRNSSAGAQQGGPHGARAAFAGRPLRVVLHPNATAGATLTVGRMPIQKRCGSGGVIPTNSTTVIPFSSADRGRKSASIEIPDHCGNGHRLTPDNVRIDQRARRWRCRQW
jgi:hypothetical protein